MRDQNLVRKRNLLARIVLANIRFGMNFDQVPSTEKRNDQAFLRRKFSPGSFGERCGISFFEFQTEARRNDSL